jgi:methylase of polypeptide subunit release factors
MKSSRQKPRITPGVRETAERLIGAGMNNLQISARLEISEGSVRNIRKKLEASKAAHAPTIAPAVPSPQEPPPAPAKRTKRVPDAHADTLTRARELFEKSMAIADEATEDGNHQAAQRATRDAGAHAILIARLEKAKTDTQDSVVIPREEVQRLVQSVRERVRTLADVPLLCPDCGRQMRIKAVKKDVLK